MKQISKDDLARVKRVDVVQGGAMTYHLYYWDELTHPVWITPEELEYINKGRPLPLLFDRHSGYYY